MEAVVGKNKKQQTDNTDLTAPVASSKSPEDRV